jgi:hypothetical protein
VTAVGMAVEPAGEVVGTGGEGVANRGLPPHPATTRTLLSTAVRIRVRAWRVAARRSIESIRVSCLLPT